MQSFKKIVSDFTLKRLFWLVLGTAILSFGIHNIHQRAAITEGGVIGLVLLMNHWLGIPASIASPLLDFVCYALAFKFLGLNFILTAAVASVSLAGFYRLWESFPPMLPDMTPGRWQRRCWAVCLWARRGTSCGGGSSGGDDALGAGHPPTDRVEAGAVVPVYRSGRAGRIALLHPGAAHCVFAGDGNGLQPAHRLGAGVRP